MKSRRVIQMASVLLVIALSTLIFFKWNDANFCGANPILQSTQSVESFTLTLSTDKCEYAQDEPIRISASLKYTGTQSTVSIMHGDPLFGMEIDPIDGSLQHEGGRSDIGITTILQKGVEHTIELGSDDSDHSSTGLLPVGKYKIKVAAQFVDWDDDDRKKYEIPVELKIRVR